ncbi:hypothetical protein R1sor_024975 [Riccia sorocarpa]|uniref:Uncharacterized protein n=1 Tax=Riccia sorocarpa TaxID=122646 RepID=A0ABD3G8S8_9MARC
MSSSSVKPFRAADIFRNMTVKKSKSKWFIRDALHVFGARSIFLQSSKKDPINTRFVVHIGQEKDQVDCLVQTEKELVCYELLLKNIQIRECSIPLQKILGPEINSCCKPCAAWLASYWLGQPMRRMGCPFLESFGRPCAAWLARYSFGNPCVSWATSSLLEWHPMCRMGCQHSSPMSSVAPHASHGLPLTFDSYPKWKFVERDSVKLALRLGILKPPQGCKAQDMLPHSKEWDAYKAREEARLKAQESARADELIEEDVEEDLASKIVSPEVDRAKKIRNDGSSQRDYVLSIPKPPPISRRPRSSTPSSSQATTSQRSESQGVPQYMVPDNTHVEETESEGEEPFPVTQTPKVQPLSALNKVELNRDEKNQIRRVAVTRCLVDQSVLRIPIEQFHVPSCDSNSANWDPYQIRACSKLFVSDLKKHIQSNAYAHYHNFILLVDPHDCKDKASWVFSPPSKWHF